MGLYFNPRNDGFKNDCTSEIYVDKTCIIKHMNKVLFTTHNCIAVSHARRFGKSQAARLLDAYYSRGANYRKLFEDLAISKEKDWDKYLHKFNVIHVDISTFVNTHKEKLLEGLSNTLYRELSHAYTELLPLSEGFAAILGDIYNQTGIPFVIIIDEWDCVIRNWADNQELVHNYMQFLHDLFKSEEARGFLALGYITGILPIKKIKDESALNNFSEYTMVNSKQLTPFFGFTEAEVKMLCQRYEMNFDSVKAWYDGYLINGQQMYNPNSVYQAMLDSSLDSYWKNTSSFESINTYITRNYDGLKDDVLTILEGGRVAVDVSPFKNDLSIIESKDDAFTALIHLGYLAYDAEMKQAFLPNYEVKTAFHDALVKGKWSDLANNLKNSDRLLTATWCKEAEKVAAIMEEAHKAYSSIIEYNNENTLSCVVTMAYYTAQAYYNIKRELEAGKGYADLTFVPRKDTANKPAIIIELKWDKTANAAIQQIKNRSYKGALEDYHGKVLLVGISYNKDSRSKDYKEHHCVIEEIII